ncbi:U4 U6.U5 tri-snRNP-associated protein [Dipsacomyces acuminosporus]|nr:U4 U6.U5 tri-snRNP-associated protein [Dipsacomyces acuminosporus]
MSTPHKRPAVEDVGTSAPAKVRKTAKNVAGVAAISSQNINKVANGSYSESEDEDQQAGAEEANCQIEGLYLDTVSRANLDFDFERLCSVSLSNNNVYACLVCGKYYQGRGKQTHAYFHSINDDHHVFINLRTLRVYVLPDNYEVKDKSLNDIKSIIQPTFTADQVSKLDAVCESSHDLAGKRYVAGFVGLNKIKCNDYMNVVIQALVHVPPIRDTLLLLPNLDAMPELVQRLATLARRMWHSKLLKAHISPHELVQEAVNRSKKRFRLDVQGDAFEFMTWLLNTLHFDLGGTRRQGSSVVYQTFQGQVEVTTQPLDDTKTREQAIDAFEIDSRKGIKVTKLPFLTLSLDLPPKPLFTDDDGEGKVSIPQVALVSLLRKYDGSTTVEWQGEAKRYWLLKLPKYIICHVKRFSRNSFSVEKNPTVVNFPICNVPFGDLLPKDAQERLGGKGTYDLIVNICHDGQSSAAAGKSSGTSFDDNQQNTAPNPAAATSSASTRAHTSDDALSAESQYLVYLRHAAADKWYMSRDLQMEPIMPQMIFLSDSYIQIWQRNDSV